MNIDYTVTLGNIIEIVSILGGGLLVMIRLNNNVISLKTEVTGMQTEIKALSDVLVKMAVADTRIAAADSRITNLEHDFRDLRKGRGWITGESGIDREYK